MRKKNVFGFNIVSRKTREVLDADQVDFSGSNYFHHADKLRGKKDVELDRLVGQLDLLVRGRYFTKLLEMS